MTPRVYNTRTETYPPGAVYVGRPSPWGNPFPMVLEAQRAAVLIQYEAWLLERPDLIAKIRRELAGKHLVCWCSPKPCHADILLRIANEEN